MPKPGQFLPRASHAHRVACKALYRSLLTYCPLIPLPPDLPSRGPVNPLKHLVRKKFKQHASLESPKQIVGALKIGYLINRLLHSASQSPTPSPALSQIHEYLHQNAAQVAQAQKLCTQPTPKPKPSVAPWPNAEKVLDVRPLPLERLSSGRRTVPTLTSTQGIPFLRFKKQQSPYLSRVLRDKMKKKLKQSAALERMEEAWGWGVEESVWDRALEEGETSAKREKARLRCRNAGRQGGEAGEGNWVDDYVVEEKRLWVEITREQVKHKEVGDRMFEIVLKERELWEKEREERRARKWEAYLKRKEEKDRQVRSEN